jgi:tetratricopeptide (TPR) repeat protein
MEPTPTAQTLIAQSLIAEADALAAAGRLEDSVRILEDALRRWPQLADSWYNLGLRRRHLGRAEAALDAYREALTRGAAGPEEIHLNRGVIFAEDLQRPDDAVREYDAALRCSPHYVPALLNLANLHEDSGRRDAARTLYERVLTLDPAHAEALARAANACEIVHTDDPMIGRLHSALARRGLPTDARASLGFALGRALDACGDHDAAWDAYTAANHASRDSAPPGTPRYDRDAHARFIDDIIRRCDSAFFARALRHRAADASAPPPPLFICGMFRSGSTLAERMLAAHPGVTAGGELSWLPSMVRRELAPFPAALDALDGAHSAALAARYETQRTAAFPQGGVLTDKRPDNFLYLGVARALFPDARFVHTRRRPLDNCLSVWFLHLDHGMSYATDLLDIAHYLLQQRRLMAHWDRLFGEAMHTLDYDALVQAPREALAALLNHCGLPWHEGCLDFHATEGTVRTASVWQVRRPLYQTSSGRWRQYAAHLAPLRAALEAGGLDPEALDAATNRG